jgi:hypothetical protein
VNIRVVTIIVVAFLAGMVADRLIGFRGSSGTQTQTDPAKSPKATIPAGQTVLGFLDMVEGKPIIDASAGKDIRVSGWAVCRAANSPLATVDILVDKQVKAQASLSHPRPDVANAYGHQEFDRSGWTAAIPAGTVGAGIHELTARVACAHGETGTLPPFHLSIN